MRSLLFVLCLSPFLSEAHICLESVPLLTRSAEAQKVYEMDQRLSRLKAHLKEIKKKEFQLSSQDISALRAQTGLLHLKDKEISKYYRNEVEKAIDVLTRQSNKALTRLFASELQALEAPKTPLEARLEGQYRDKVPTDLPALLELYTGLVRSIVRDSQGYSVFTVQMRERIRALAVIEHLNQSLKENKKALRAHKKVKKSQRDRAWRQTHTELESQRELLRTEREQIYERLITSLNASSTSEVKSWLSLVEVKKEKKKKCCRGTCSGCIFNFGLRNRNEKRERKGKTEERSSQEGDLSHLPLYQLQPL